MNYNVTITIEFQSPLCSSKILVPAEGLVDLLTRIFICILLPSEHLLGYIAYSFNRFCSSIHAKVRKVVIGAIWIRGRLTCFVDSAGVWCVNLF